MIDNRLLDSFELTKDYLPEPRKTKMYFPAFFSNLLISPTKDIGIY